MSNSRDIARRMNFHGDADLTTPGHDALTLWAKSHVVELFYAASIWPALQNLVQSTVADINKHQQDRYTWNELADYKKKVADYNWKLRSNLEFAQAYPNAPKPESPKHPGVPPPPPVPIFTPSHWVIYDTPKLEVKTPGGWIDVLIRGSVFPFNQHNFDGWECLIEVKTTIPSFGELIRQLREYKNGLWGLHQSPKLGLVCVLSPDDRFAEAIRAEGFYFAKMDIPK